MYLFLDQLPLKGFEGPLPGPALQSVHEQGCGEVNEDVLLVSEDTYGVFDGATSLSSSRLAGGKTGGFMAASIAADTFRKDNRTLKTVAGEANARIGRTCGLMTDCDDRTALWSTSLAVIRMNDTSIDYCQSGDAVALFILRDGGLHYIGADVDIDRETLTMWKELDWRPGISIYEALADQIRKVRRGMNRSYGVLNGEPEALSFVKYGSIDRADVAEVLLFTDGLLLPNAEPAEGKGMEEFADLYRKDGLHGLHRHVRRMEREDPDCRKYPRFKQHDDIAALSLRL